jgi:hypothetical protein
VADRIGPNSEARQGGRFARAQRRVARRALAFGVAPSILPPAFPFPTGDTLLARSGFAGRASVCGRSFRSGIETAARGIKISGRRIGNEAKEMAVTCRSAWGATLAVSSIAALLALTSADDAAAQSTPVSFFDLNFDIDAGIGFLYDDNVTRAPSGPDKIADQFYTLNASKAFAFPLTDFTRFTLDAFARGEVAQRYSGLGNIFGGAQGALQYRGSTEFDAPTFTVFARALGEQFGSDLRSGYRFSAGVSARQPVTERLGVFVAYAHNWRNADNEVFDTRDNSVLASVDYSIAPYGTLTFTAEYHRGTIASTGQPTLTIVDIAQVFVNDDVFTSPQMIDYRFEANSVLTTLNYNLPINPSAALDFSWRRVQSTSREQATFPGGGSLKYIDNQFNVLLAFRF